MKELRNKSKAETLIILNKTISNFNIPKTYFFDVNKFNKKKNKILKKIKKEFNNLVAIRSSNKFEDSNISSNAGKFKSFLNIDPKNSSIVEKTIKEVIKSYSRHKSKKNQILIQSMVKNVKTSGVCTSCDLETYFPAYQINYFEGKDTEAVTSGKPNTKKIIFVENNKYRLRNKNFDKLIKIVKKIKQFYKSHIDVEFAINSNDKIFILQSRSIVIKRKNILDTNTTNFALQSLGRKINNLQKRHHDLLGNTAYYSVMSDWNPAEMIGLKPKPLALSLYKELITDSVWAESRKSYGYRDVSSNQLMTTFFGTPFIDLRVDFNSWIPSKLSNKVAEKLINFYLRKFKSNINLHDKIEFDILYSCYTFDTKKKLNSLKKHNFSQKEVREISESLKKINNYAFEELEKEISRIKILVKKQDEMKKSSLDYIAKIYWLISDCKNYGTYSFSGLARCAFISTELLNSMVNNNILSLGEKEKFLQSIETITTEMKKDYSRGKKNFLTKYGHLRPNTYEISSKNYKEGFSLYFGKNFNKKNKENRKKFKFTEQQKNKINYFLKKENLKISVNNFIKFLIKSIQLRESSKFIFTKSIDMVFDNLKLFSKNFGLKIDDITYIKINKILNMYYNYTTFKNIPDLKKEIHYNKKEYNYNYPLKLPEVITNVSELFIIKNKNMINFVGNQRANGKILHLNKFKNSGYDKKIVCIENADPGFDFIFTKKINGLITKFGGANSHMAIRCAELGIPAAIGVGDTLFEQIIKSNVITIECDRKKLIIEGKYNS